MAASGELPNQFLLSNGCTTRDCRDSGNFGSCHVDSSLCSGVPPRTPALASLLVGQDVERDEENKIGAENDTASDGSEFFARAMTRIGHPGPICGSEIGVASKVDKDCIQYQQKNQTQWGSAYLDRR